MVAGELPLLDSTEEAQTRGRRALRPAVFVRGGPCRDFSSCEGEVRAIRAARCRSWWIAAPRVERRRSNLQGERPPRVRADASERSTPPRTIAHGGELHGGSLHVRCRARARSPRSTPPAHLPLGVEKLEAQPRGQPTRADCDRVRVRSVERLAGGAVRAGRVRRRRAHDCAE
jgi:hypothetical protein